MKTFLVILFSLLTTFCYSQRIEIDNNISVVFPEQPIETEEVIEGYSTKLYSLNTTDSFLALRLQGTQQSLSLPTDKQQLKKLYEVISSDFINNLNRKGLKTHSSSFVQRDNLLVYQILFVDEKSTNQNGKAVVIYFNEVAYIFIYSELHKYSSERSNMFFNSIDIHGEVSQYKAKYNYFVALIKVLVLLGLAVSIRVILKRRNKASS